MKNFAMGVKIDPKVEMGLSMLEIDGWKILRLSNRKLLEEFIDVTVELLIGTLCRDSFSAMHYAVTSTREGLHGMMHRYRRQHFAAGDDLHEHPRGHSSWRESTRMKFMTIQMEYSKMRSEPSENMWKTRVILIHLENYFGKYAQEVWERNWMNSDMHTMLLDTNNRKLMELRLQKLRGQSEKDDQMKIAGEITGSVPETSLDWESILKE